ncbi:hypothetical protein [Mesorhizobium sp. M0676]|uniref:hypothetical protein n=1 Tax=Mesorhizobium sp. M0676 TaxID=2956984 RepID=UPI0033351E8D
MGRSFSSRKQLAALRGAGTASLGDGERENEHDATLECKTQSVKLHNRASHYVCMAQARLKACRLFAKIDHSNKNNSLERSILE